MSVIVVSSGLVGLGGGYLLGQQVAT